MPLFDEGQKLLEEHQPEKIRFRLSQKRRYSHLGDAILGAIDGCITTFAIVAGAIGGRLSTGIALLLGAANLLADGLSMAASNFQKSKSEGELIEKIRRTEKRHIEKIPEGEKEEIRQLFEKKGFSEPLLSRIVEQITKDQRLWIDTMITEEYGLPLEKPNPFHAGLVTFTAFVLVGTIPLLPLILATYLMSFPIYPASILMTGLTFFGIGLLKGRWVRRSPLRSGLETLGVGGLAALLAYGVGALLRNLVL